MADKCEIFVNGTKTTQAFAKTSMTVGQGICICPESRQYIGGYRCERKKMCVKCKIYMTVTAHFIVINIVHRYSCMYNLKMVTMSGISLFTEIPNFQNSGFRTKLLHVNTVLRTKCL